MLGVCSLEVLVLTYLPAPSHTSRFSPLITWAVTWKTASVCYIVITGSDGLDWSVSMAHIIARQEAAGCVSNDAEPPCPLRDSDSPADSAGLDRQKMLSFAPCGTIRANSIKIPSKEERWNCVMVVGELNLVMILSRGKWSCSANIMINSLQSTRFSFLHPLTISFPSTHMHILLP